jgi:hypothetical protein
MFARPLFLIATGESRHEYPIGELKEEGHFVMGINRVVREVPLHFAHFQDVSDYCEDVVKYQDQCIAVVPGESPMVQMNEKVVTFRYPRTRIPQSGSGMTGLHVAALMGFDPIYLVGYDYTINGVERYVHDCQKAVEFKKNFDTEVFNCSKKSKLTHFPYRSFDDCRYGEC